VQTNARRRGATPSASATEHTEIEPQDKQVQHPFTLLLTRISKVKDPMESY